MENDRQSSDSNTASPCDDAGRLAVVFSKVLRLPRSHVHPDLVPEQVPRWDSVGHMALILAIEEEFGLQFEVDDIMEFVSFGSILKVVERAMRASTAEGTERVA